MLGSGLALASSLVAAWLLAARLLPHAGPATRWLVRLLLAVALPTLVVQLAATLELLGWIDAVRTRGVGLAMAMAAVALALVPGRSGAPSSPLPPTSDGARSRARATWWLGLPLAGTYALFAIEMLVGFPRGWDSGSYHLPLAVRWLQGGSLAIPASGAWELSQPGNGHIALMLWLGTGAQWTAAAPSLIAAVVAALSVLLLATEIGATPSGAAAAVLVALSVPLVHFQAFNSYVDLYAAGFFVAGIALWLSSRRVPSEREALIRLALAGLAVGLATGTRVTFYLYGALFTAVAGATSLLARRHPGQPPAARWTSVLVLLVAVLLPSCFWWLRALAATGNPLYPIGLEIAGLELAGFDPSHITDHRWYLHYARTKWDMAFYPWVEYKRSGYPFSVDAGTGAAFATFVPVGLLWALAAWRRAAGRRFAIGVLLAFVAATLVAFEPLFRFMLRFVLPAILVAVALSALLFDHLERTRPRFRAVLLALTVATTALLIAWEPVRLLGGRLKRGAWSRAAVLQVPEAIDALPAGTRLLHLPGGREPDMHGGDPFNFAVQGRHLRTRVVPSFEAPSAVTGRYLDERGIEYIARRGPGNEEALAPVSERLELVVDESGDERRHEDYRWRLWRVRHPTSVDRAPWIPGPEQSSDRPRR